MNTEFAELIKARECGRLNISGDHYSKKKAIRRSLIGLLLVVIGAYGIWWTFTGPIASDWVRGIALFICGVIFIIGWCVPSGNAEYLDLRMGQVVKQRWYGISPPLSEEKSLTEFSRIVVRHVCHPGGEGDDTFTGSVGLKHKAAAPVIWVKEFPATKDEVPTQPDVFAKGLSELIGLPYGANDSDQSPEAVKGKTRLDAHENAGGEA